MEKLRKDELLRLANDVERLVAHTGLKPHIFSEIMLAVNVALDWIEVDEEGYYIQGKLFKPDENEKGWTNYENL